MAWLESLPVESSSAIPQSAIPNPQWVIPVCYEMQFDLARVCEATGLPADEVIRLHCATTYTVYAIGFVPGFPYMGYLP